MTGMQLRHYSRRYPILMGFTEKEVIATIRQFVECESPSDDAASVNRFVDLLAETVKDIARVKTYSGGKAHGHAVGRQRARPVGARVQHADERQDVRHQECSGDALEQPPQDQDLRVPCGSASG